MSFQSKEQSSDPQKYGNGILLMSQQMSDCRAVHHPGCRWRRMGVRQVQRLAQNFLDSILYYYSRGLWSFC